jgi:hypothetical protein
MLITWEIDLSNHNWKYMHYFECNIVIPRALLIHKEENIKQYYFFQN